MGTIKKAILEKRLIQLTEVQVIEIAASKKDIKEGFLVDNRTLKKEVKTWLKER